MVCLGNGGWFYMTGVKEGMQRVVGDERLGSECKGF